MLRRTGYLWLCFLWSLSTFAARGDDACEQCLDQARVVASYIDAEVKPKEQAVFEFLSQLCHQMGIQTPRVCTGAVDSFGPEVIEIVAERLHEGRGICAIMGFCPRSDYAARDLEDWKKRVWQSPAAPKAKKPKVAHSGDVGSFIHITDVHLDEAYEIGGATPCGEPLCCRRDSPPVEGSKGARAFGETDCDVPLATVQSVFAKANDLAPDFVVVTGDIAPHNVWEQSVKAQMQTQEIVANVAKQEVAKRIPIYWTIGNHDVYPVDNLHPDQSRETILALIAELWSDWLPEAAVATVRKGGYYTVLHSPGVRIASVNTQACDNFNFWLQMGPRDADHFDPFGQLGWLLDVLRKAEAADEKVFILGHIPPGDSGCFSHYHEKYIELMRRFSSTIAAQIFGHTHDDEFRVFFATDSSASGAVGAVFTSPAVTAYSDTNPSLRRYYYDRQGARLVDYEQWYADINDANTRGALRWQLAYEARSEYGLADLEPESWFNLYQQMLHDPDGIAMQKYIFHYNGQKPRSQPCDDGCKRRLLCQMGSATLATLRKCTGDQPGLDQFLEDLYILNVRPQPKARQ